MAQMKTQAAARNSSIELLRVITMILIVFHHFAYHGGFSWTPGTLSLPLLWYDLILMGGKVGVNVFVLISGYYLISDEGQFFRPDKAAKFLGQVLFYSLALFFLFGLAGRGDMGPVSLIKACLPLTFSTWWFASAYFVLYLLHPFLNLLLRGMDRALYQKFLLLLVLCWSVIPTLTTSDFQLNHLLWFATLYSIAGYIRLYGLNSKFTSKHYGLFCLLCSCLTYASCLVFTLLGRRWSVFAEHATYFYTDEKITTLLISLSLFMAFATMKMKYHKWINAAASATFGVYLIHDHSAVRQFLWIDLFQNARWQESPLLIPCSILVVALVYLLCSLIDLLRQRVIERPFLALVRRCPDHMTALPGKALALLKDLIFGAQRSEEV